MAESLGTLSVALTAETQQFSFAMQRAKTLTEEFGQSLKTLANLNVLANAELGRMTQKAYSLSSVLSDVKVSNIVDQDEIDNLKRFTDGTENANNKSVVFGASLRALSGAIRIFAASSIVLNLAAMSDAFGEGVTKAAQFAAVLSGVAETMGHLGMSVAALKTGFLGFVLPITAALTGLYGSIVAIIGALKLLREGFRFKEGTGFLDKIKTIFGTGQQVINEKVAETKQALFGMDFSDIWEDRQNEVQLGMMAYDEALEKQAKSLKELADQRKRLLEKEKQAREREDEEWARAIEESANRLYDVATAESIREAFSQGLTSAVNTYLNEAKLAAKGQAQKNVRFVNQTTANSFSAAKQDMFGKFDLNPSKTDMKFPSLFNAAVDAFGWNFAEGLHKTAVTITSHVSTAGKQFASVVVSRMGEAGSVIQSGLEGFKNGGIWGAIIGVLADLVTRNEHFKAAVDDANRVLGELVDAFTPLTKAMQPMAMVLHNGLRIIASQLTPILEFIAPIFEALGQAMLAITYGILYFIKAHGKVWNGFIGVIQDFLRTLADVKIFGKKIFGFFDDWADGMDRALINLNGINRNIEELNDMQIYEDTKLDNFGDGLSRATDAVNDFVGVLNAPTGFKYALAKYKATDVGGGMMGGPGGGRPLTQEQMQQIVQNINNANNSTTTTNNSTSFNISGTVVNQPPNLDAFINEFRDRHEYLVQASQSMNAGANNGIPPSPPPDPSTYVPATASGSSGGSKAPAASSHGGMGGAGATAAPTSPLGMMSASNMAQPDPQVAKAAQEAKTAAAMQSVLATNAGSRPAQVPPPSLTQNQGPNNQASKNPLRK